MYIVAKILGGWGSLYEALLYCSWLSTACVTLNIANVYCRTLSILRMWRTLLVVQGVPGTLSWRCIMTTQI